MADPMGLAAAGLLLLIGFALGGAVGVAVADWRQKRKERTRAHSPRPL